MRWDVLLPRMLVLAALAGLSARLLWSSTLLTLLPQQPPAWALPLAIGVLFVPALLTRGTPLALTLSVLGPILAIASYDQSRLDWLRLLKDFGLTQDEGPSVLRVILGLGALLLAWTLHVSDHAFRLRARALERGVDEGEAGAAFTHVLRVGARRGLLALSATALLAAIAAGAMMLQADRLLAGRASLLAPLLAAVLVAGAALLLVRGDEKRRA